MALLGRDFNDLTNEQELPLIGGDVAVTIQAFFAGRRSQSDPGVVYLRITRRQR